MNEDDDNIASISSCNFNFFHCSSYADRFQFHIEKKNYVFKIDFDLLDEKVSCLECCCHAQRNTDTVALICNILISIYDKSSRSEMNKLNRLSSLKRTTIESDKSD